MSRRLRYVHRSAARPVVLGGWFVLGALVACGADGARQRDAASGGPGGDAAASTGGSSGGGRSGVAGGAPAGGGAAGLAGAGVVGGAAPAGTAGAGGRQAAGGGGEAPGRGGAGTGGVAGTAGAGPGPAVGAYGTRARLLASNSEMGAAEVGGKIYVVGGYPSSRVVQTAVQVYDIATDRWSAGLPYPFAIHHPVLASVAGKLYSLGGQTDAADTNRTFVFDPLAASPGWRELRAMPTARGAGAAAVVDDKIYVIAGRPPAGNKFEVYDVSDDAWTALADLPQAYPQRNHIAAATLGGKIYVAGGRYNGGGFGDPRTDALDIFDPATGAWTVGAKMPRPRGGVNGVAAYGCFHVWGGEGTNTGEPNDVYPDHDVYDPRTNTWRALPRLPTPIHGVTGAAFFDGLIYIPGGGTMSGGSSGSTLFQVFRPDPIARCDQG